MTASSSTHEAANDGREFSLLALATVLLRWRRAIIVLGLLGGVLGLTKGLTSRRVYRATATFIPQTSEDGGASRLAAAVGQLGMRIPGSGGGWGPAMYVQILRSRAVLEPIALDTVELDDGRRIPVMDVLQIEDQAKDLRVDAAVRAMQHLVSSRHLDALGAVEVSVITPWPRVSLALAQKLLRAVNRFNFETRKSQAEAERQFVEVQASEAERALLAAEERLQAFLERNRVISGSPELAFRKDRLERDVALRQQLYTTLLQSREEARIREVRDTPVITVLEEPRLPLIGEPRKSAQKAILGGLFGGMVGIFLALIAEAVSAARRARSAESQEFFRVVDQLTPRFLRRS